MTKLYFLHPKLYQSFKMNELIFRLAIQNDLPAIVKMLASDDLGSSREQLEGPLDDQYVTAFSKILNDSNSQLIVATIHDEVIGVLQLNFITFLTYKGSTRALIEGVRICENHRSKGFGRKMFEYAISKAKEQNCHMVQLTTNKSRKDALKFYESIGFIASHEGMKLFLK
jgi:GNAT superfamily N-acetyltransferase